MGSKKHKKHHKSEKKEKNHDAPERIEKRLKLVLKVGGSSASEHGDSPHIHSGSEQPSQLAVPEEMKPLEYERLAEKHKKAKKKKKKKSSEKEKHEKRHRHHHHHHSHDKKDKRKRDPDESSQDDADVLDETSEPSLKRVLFEEDLPERPFREPRACTLKFRQGKSSLQLLLDFLLKALEKKDPQQFFAWPVTDHIAPGYSSIISTPMDFSTMRQKIDNNEYPTLSDFKVDVKLLCDNCMTYNRPDTVYYKTAKKMLHVALKMMTKEKLLPLRHTLPYMAEITRDELGFDLGITSDDCVSPEAEPIEIDENTPIKEERKRTPSIPNSKFEAYQDDLSPDEILAEAQKAAADAAAKLTLKRPNSKFGFLRQRHDGTTTLAILNPEEGRAQDGRVTLEMLMGKLTQGTGSLAGFREDKRNITKPVNYVNYGPFSSYAPTYDSTFANLTKEESDLLYTAYGDDTGFQYAESILNFTKDSTYMTAIVDNLLDVLTNGEHSKAMKVIEEKRKTKETSHTKQDIVPTPDRQNCRAPTINRPPYQKSSPSKEVKAQSGNVTIDYESLRSLADLGIDVSFLDDMETSKEIKVEPKSDAVIQKKLDETSDLLTSLHQAQHDRLSLKPPPHLSHVMEPSVNEIQLADKVSESLKDLAKQVSPGAITSIVGLRKAMGISLQPFFRSEDPTGVNASPTRSPHIDVDASTHEGHSSNSSPHMDRDGSATDLESELQEFLETGPSLHVTGSPSQVDDALDENLLV